MFTLVDGRNELYQWDLNRQIAVNDADVTEVHFCNRTDDCSLVVEVKNGVADIPNILLQETWDIRVYAYCTEYTKIEERFKVKARTKPSDYIYTETEVKTIEAIEQRINDLEASFHDNIDEAVREYIEENPIEIDLSHLAEKDHKHTIADITDYEEPDLSEYAKKNDIPSLNGYATEKYVDDAVANLDIPEVDLDGYATENWVKNQGYINSIPGEYITDTELIAKGYASKDDLSIYAKKSDIPDVSDFITSIPAEYITEDELNAKGYLTKHQSLDGYATEDYVDDAIANAKIDIEQIDLSDYAKKEDIPDVSEFISEIPEEYVTEEELSKKGYLTQHQDISGKADTVHKHSISDITDYTAPDLSGYATIKYVDAAIANVDIPGGVAASQVVYLDFSYYYEYDPLIENVVVPDEQEIIFNQIVAGKKLAIYVKDEVQYLPAGFAYGENSIVFYYHKSAITSGTDKKHIFAWNCKAVRNVDTGVWKITITDESISRIATESYVQSQIRQAQLGGDVDLSEYAKKEDIPDVSDFLSEIPAEYITETELNNKGYQTEAQVTDLINEALGVIENGSY